MIDLTLLEIVVVVLLIGLEFGICGLPRLVNRFSGTKKEFIRVAEIEEQSRALK